MDREIRVGIESDEGWWGRRGCGDIGVDVGGPVELEQEGLTVTRDNYRDMASPGAKTTLGFMPCNRP